MESVPRNERQRATAGEFEQRTAWRRRLLPDAEVLVVMPVKCPFCSFNNEDGALFCEQCKSDISGVAAAPAGASPSAMPEAAPMAVVEEVAVAEVMPIQAVDV